MNSAGRVSANLPVHEPLVLRNINADLILNVQSSRPRPNRRVQLWDDVCNKGNHWQLQQVQGTSRFRICPELNSELCLGLADSLSGPLAASRDAILVRHDHWSACWKFTVKRTGVYTIENVVQGVHGVAGSQEFFAPTLAAQLDDDEIEEDDVEALCRLGMTVAAGLPSPAQAARCFDEWQLEPVLVLPQPSQPAMYAPPQLGGDSPFHLPPVPLPVSGLTVLLQHVRSHLYLNIRGSKPWDEQLVRLWDGAHDDGNYWTLQRTPDFQERFCITSFRDPALRLCFRTIDGRLTAWARPQLTAAETATRWEFRPCRLGSAVTILNIMPMQYRYNASLDCDAFLRVWEQEGIVSKGTVPCAIEDADQEWAAWLILPVKRHQGPSRAVLPALPNEESPASMIVDEEGQHPGVSSASTSYHDAPLPQLLHACQQLLPLAPRAGTSSATAPVQAEVQVHEAPLPQILRAAPQLPPPGPHLAPHLWTQYEDPNTRRVWFCSNDEQWASGDGRIVVRYQPLPAIDSDSPTS